MTWNCDACGEPIGRPEDGVLEWITLPLGSGSGSGSGAAARGLQLVHRHPASPRPHGCGYNEEAEFAEDRGTLSDIDLTYMVGPDGLVRLLELLDDGDLPRTKLLEMIMRLHLPNYEEARHHIDAAVAEGVFYPNSRDGFYTQDQLEATLRFAVDEEA